MVVITDARIKYRINMGKIFRKFTFSPPEVLVLVRYNARTSVIGMIASVLVSFTVTALSSVLFPRWYMESQVDAAAVTEEVSFTAVPAKMPNTSPDWVENPSIVPSSGNRSAASILKKK